MLARYKNLVILLLLQTYHTGAQIRIVCTAALLDAQADVRQQEYTHSINIIKNLGYEPYIIEACKQQGPTFFDTLSSQLFYATVNNPSLKNKGVNEGKTLLQGLKAYKFDDNDIVIKLTGRYYFTSDYLLRLINSNPTRDAFFLLTDANTQVFTGCFAMRYKQLIAMLDSFDYERMEVGMINIEWEVARYIQHNRTQKLKVLYVDKLDVQGKVFGRGDVNLNQVMLLSW